MFGNETDLCVILLKIKMFLIFLIFLKKGYSLASDPLNCLITRIAIEFKLYAYKVLYQI